MQRPALWHRWQTIAIIVIVLIIGLMLMPAFPHGGEPGRGSACISNLKQTVLAALMYADDFDDRLPAAGTWATRTLPYARNGEKNFYFCPRLTSRAPDEYGHA